MSTVSFPSLPGLPNYNAFQIDSPEYTRNPLANEQRLLLRGSQSHPSIPDGSFSKSSKTTGSLTLQIYGQLDGIAVPVFGKGSMIHGKVYLQKRDAVSSVDIKLEGWLRLQEVGGAGRTSEKILEQQLNIWSRDESASCPSSIDFTLPLRESYEKDQQRYALPPTFEVHLSGLPGFRADVSYTMTVTVTKTKASLFGNHTVVSTPFIYFPRTRPMKALPLPPSPSTFLTSLGYAHPDWEVVESVMGSRSSHTNPILTKLYIPSGRTFCVKNAVPFRLHISSSALSLATFLPCSPTAYPPGGRTHDSKKGVTRVYVVRQVSVDVRQVESLGTKTDIFKVWAAGEGTFKRLGDGPDWAAWEGEVNFDQSVVKVGSFKASGLWVKDCIILSIIPPSPHNSPLVELRTAVPIRLVTEPHASDVDFDPAEWSGSERDAKNGDPTN